MTFGHFEAEPDPGHFGIRVVDALWRTEWLTGRLQAFASAHARARTIQQQEAVRKSMENITRIGPTGSFRVV